MGEGKNMSEALLHYTWLCVHDCFNPQLYLREEGVTNCNVLATGYTASYLVVHANMLHYYI